jgi:hypothetical protein
VIEDDFADVPLLVQQLAETQRTASPGQAARIRELFARQGLPEAVTHRVQQKYDQHVEQRSEWPDDTTPEEYLESLRATVTDVRSGIYATFEPELGDWVVYFVGPVRRAWRGPRAGERVVVLFRREPQRWITGFQPRDGDAYVDSQGGFWVFRPR